MRILLAGLLALCIGTTAFPVQQAQTASATESSDAARGADEGPPGSSEPTGDEAGAPVPGPSESGFAEGAPDLENSDGAPSVQVQPKPQDAPAMREEETANPDSDASPNANSSQSANASPNPGANPSGTSPELAALTASLKTLRDELAQMSEAFSASRDEFDLGGIALESGTDTARGLHARIRELDERRQRALRLAEAAQTELEQPMNEWMLILTRGLSGFRDAQAHQEMLERLVVSRQDYASQLLEEQNALQDEAASGLIATYNVRSEIREALLEVNRKAGNVERCCASIRQCACDIRSQIQADQEGKTPDPDAITQAQSSANEAEALAASSESLIGAWYDEIDELFGAAGSLSFGAGAEFSLPESEFVEKWGSAIDAFYANSPDGVGEAPLAGYGRAMASSAYRHRVDPRLCAAVSIVESSGGRHCIRPHNAWGWGAADSDPYGLAAEWSSFDEAIEAWHVNMAESKTGLATVPSVSALGAIYCSSPRWGANVIEQMERIGEYATD